MIDEIWKDVKDYEGLYQVSTYGNVRSLNYKGKQGVVQNLKLIITKKGYVVVTLVNRQKKSKQKQVHRLVATAFIPNPYNLDFVNHKDENKENNQIDNLEWCTVEYNNHYGTKNIRSAITNTGKFNNPKLSNSVECVETTKIYASAAEASRQTGIYVGNIRRACIWQKYTAGGYHWKLINTTSIKKYKQKVVCIETKEVFESIKEAESVYATHHITDCCKGYRQTSGGYHWKYLE